MMARAYEPGGAGTGPNSGKTAAEIAATTPARKKTSEEILSGVNQTIANIDTTVADTQAAIDEANAATVAAEDATIEAKSLSRDENDTSYVDAYQRLYDEFKILGLGALVEDAKDLLIKSTSIASMPDALTETKAYRERFSANDARIKAGLTALSPAQYLAKEDAYQEVMRKFGLPASYYKTGLYGKQEGFDKLLSNDVSASELTSRISTAQDRVLNANPEVRNAIMKFYGDSITDGDILAYVLDPSNAVEMIKRKVTAAEIGGAAMAQNLATNAKRAEELAALGITKEVAQEGYTDVAEMAPRGSQLADIYNQGDYNQATAEADVFNTAGAAEARAKKKKLKSLEEASFSGSSGVGALGRDRGTNYGTTQSGFGSY
jgi:hypothetical protein